MKIRSGRGILIYSAGQGLRYSKRKMAKSFADSGDPDQTGLHWLPVTLLGVSRLQ